MTDYRYLLSRVLIWINTLFTPKYIFEETEWILKYQIFAILVISFSFSLGLLPFSFFRLQEGNLVVGMSQLSLSIFFLYGYSRLKRDKSYYHSYSILFMIIFFLYSTLIFFYVPQNHLNILWVISAPILVFFFLNKKSGLVMFAWVIIFIAYLLWSNYHYNIAEYVTLVSAFLVTSFAMYIYEHAKESEKNRLLKYSEELKAQVDEKTNTLLVLNKELEQRVEEEVEQRIRHEELLLRKARMASMGEMIDAIAHQWRQPLMNINAVMMNIDRGIETKKESAILKEKILEVFSLTAHMSHTIEDFRNFLQVEKKKGHFLLEEMLTSVLTLIRYNLKNIDVTSECVEGLAIEGYKSELSQVLITLLSNAAEILETKQGINKKIYIRLEENKDEVIISIEDNAGGIEEQNLSKIFDPYFTTKKQTGGTGLGLYIAKIIIEHNMKGSLNVFNTKIGALFTIKIPKDS